MIDGLLEYSLERVSSLEHFYNSEYKTIEAKSRKGAKLNHLGYILDMYLSLLIMSDGEEKNEESFLRLKKQAEKYIEVIEECPDGKTTRVRYIVKNLETLKSKGYELNLSKAASAYRKYIDMPIIHGSNTLIMLITRFEEFISNLISEMYILFPQRYLDKQQICFSEIVDCGVDEVRKKIVYREVDAIMRQSYTEWFKLFESHGLNFDSCKTEMEELREIYARRNILVHNAGEVNDIYLNNVPKSKAKKGDFLYATNAYLEKAFQTIKIIIFTIMLEAVKFVKDNKDEYLYSIFVMAFDLLVDKNYELCKHIFSALKNSKYAAENTKKLSQINYWLSIKGLNGTKAIKEEVEAFDVSALNQSFVLAKVILLEDYEKATVLISAMFEKKELPVSALQEWPLFEDYRTTKFYEEFSALHAKEFNISEIEVENTSDAEQTEEKVCIGEELTKVELA